MPVPKVGDTMSGREFGMSARFPPSTYWHWLFHLSRSNAILLRFPSWLSTIYFPYHVTKGSSHFIQYAPYHQGGLLLRPRTVIVILMSPTSSTGQAAKLARCIPPH